MFIQQKHRQLSEISVRHDIACHIRKVGDRGFARFLIVRIGQLFGFPVNGRRVRFEENVFYEFREDRIRTVWSVIDKASVAGQI